MAKKKEEGPKTVLERAYIIPLRREWLRTPRYKRAKKAISAIRGFVEKHMKTEEVKIGRTLNLSVWKHGMKNPPHKISVNCVKDDTGVVTVELTDKPVERIASVLRKSRAKEEKKEKKKAAAAPKEKAVGEKPTVTGEKKDEAKEKIEEALQNVEKKLEDHVEEAKEVEKEEIKELKEQPPKQQVTPEQKASVEEPHKAPHGGQKLTEEHRDKAQ